MGFEVHLSGSNSGSGFGQVMKFLCVSTLPTGHGVKNSAVLTEMLGIVGHFLRGTWSTACLLADAV